MSLAGLHSRALRALFPEGTRQAVVDGLPVALEALSVRSMNFGQHWRTPGVTPVSYRLELPRSFLVAFLAEPAQLPEWRTPDARPILTTP